MYRIDNNNCPDGWAYVVDYMGNKVFYGPVRECEICIKALTKKGGSRK